MSTDGFWSVHRLIVKIGPILVLEGSVRLTIDVDDESLKRAATLTGMDDHAALIRCALELLVRIESGRQLCALGGSDREAVAAPRWRG
jgi:Arc/MetJ family transcription regulator